MKVTIKTLNSSTFTVDLEESATVGDLRQAIFKETNIPKELQKLIIAGKFLNNDDLPIANLQLNEKSFIVLMQKKVANPAPAQPKVVEQPKPAEQPKPVEQPKPAEQPTVPSNQSSSPSSQGFFVDESTVQSLTAMGFSRDASVKALRAAFGNADRAVDYLLNGIPEETSNSQPSLPAEQLQSNVPVTENDDDVFGSDDAMNAPSELSEDEKTAFIEKLSQNESLRNICLLINEQPDALKVILPKLMEVQPELAQLLTSDKTLIPRLVKKVVDSVGPDGVAAFAAARRADMDEESDIAPQIAPAQEQSQGQFFGEQVTAADKEAIDRLCELGFDRAMAIQAYFVCGKNEQLAANFLLENAAN